MAQLIIQGGKKLNGTVRISGSKNAALPILAASLLTDRPCEIRNVPNIGDVHTMLSILRSLGSELEFHRNVVRIQTKQIDVSRLPRDLCMKMRASILLLAPLLARCGKVDLPYPGGCVLGKRSAYSHVSVLETFGAKQKNKADSLAFSGKFSATHMTMPEFSVTATENAIMAAVAAPGKTMLHLAATEPHVRDLCDFLVALGAKIEGIGTHRLTIFGGKKLHGGQHAVTGDYLEAGTLLLAGALTRGTVTITNIVADDLDAFVYLMRDMGVPIVRTKSSITVKPYKKLEAARRLQTNVFPGFPTDLQPPFCILLTQAAGDSLIHETLFEGRFKYFGELEKMGAKIKVLNPHQAVVTGPKKLKGKEVKSWDLRAGAAMVLAGLVANGTTKVTDIAYIDRGYEKFEEKLRALGADIVREN
ncbi:UDP-N-acetylglucosamine 1-carboxyvinyltransferase [Candidatus Peregrinibacteria bacterium CG11_big_fil_rev_8_21_14_0_20_46_8]|nr:MAG: UDP-N-acetylglucosamine 1-carboxyvinyltransferase [Candidatus Peregrinibacteria bacterium CG11_big_fil_rev_8_21_14_0_20_46_8]